jgi:hypothetical protein
MKIKFILLCFSVFICIVKSNAQLYDSFKKNKVGDTFLLKPSFNILEYPYKKVVNHKILPLLKLSLLEKFDCGDSMLIIRFDKDFTSLFNFDSLTISNSINNFAYYLVSNKRVIELSSINNDINLDTVIQLVKKNDYLNNICGEQILKYNIRLILDLDNVLNCKMLSNYDNCSFCKVKR